MTTTATATALPPLKLTRIRLERYSQTENRIFEILKAQRGRQISTEELTRKFYDGNVPIHGRTIISGTLNKLIEKVKRNERHFRVCRSERTGPISTFAWIERR